MMQKRWLAICITGTLIMIVVMGKTGASLKSPGTPLGIINLELPFTTAKANTVLTTWQQSTDDNGISNIQAAKNNTWWDFLFILFYSALLFTVAGLISRHRWKATSMMAQKAVLAVALLDVVENIGMFQLLGGKVSTAMVLLTSIAAAAKWILVLAVIVFIMAACLAWLLQKRGRKNSTG